MQILEDTPARWEGVIADLTAKANTYDNEVTELTQSRDALALDAELGKDGAAKALQRMCPFGEPAWVLLEMVLMPLFRPRHAGVRAVGVPGRTPATSSKVELRLRRSAALAAFPRPARWRRPRAPPTPQPPPRPSPSTNSHVPHDPSV